MMWAKVFYYFECLEETELDQFKDLINVFNVAVSKTQKRNHSLWYKIEPVATYTSEKYVLILLVKGMTERSVEIYQDLGYDIRLCTTNEIYRRIRRAEYKCIKDDSTN